jgi:hypothetical protein
VSELKLQFELSATEKMVGFAPQLYTKLVEFANKVAHANQDPSLPQARLNYSQGYYGLATIIIKALEEAGVKCPVK